VLAEMGRSPSRLRIFDLLRPYTDVVAGGLLRDVVVPPVVISDSQVAYVGLMDF
jgi:hypothetical protein